MLKYMSIVALYLCDYLVIHFPLGCHVLLSVSGWVASPYRQLGLAVVKGVRGYTNSPADPDNAIVVLP